MAMPSLVIQATWAAAGGTVIIYLAALTGVPPELYDAAEVDGASLWHKVRYITLPLLRGVLFITLILQMIGTAQVFLEPFLFTAGGPGERDDDRAPAHLQVRVPEQPRRRLRVGDRAQPHARGVPRGLRGDLLPAHPAWSDIDDPAAAAAGARAGTPTPDRGLVSAADWRHRRVRWAPRLSS